MSLKTKKRLGEILIEVGAIDGSRLEGALTAQRQFGGKIGDMMVDYGFITDYTLARAIARQFDIPVITDLVQMKLGMITSLITPATAARCGAVPVRVKGTTLFVAMKDPADLDALATLKRQTNYTIYPLVCPRSELDAALQYYYEGLNAVAVDADPRTHSSKIVRNDDPEKWAPIIYSRG